MSPIRGRALWAPGEPFGPSAAVALLLCAIVNQCHKDIRLAQSHGSKAWPYEQRQAIEAEQFLSWCRAEFGENKGSNAWKQPK